MKNHIRKILWAGVLSVILLGLVFSSAIYTGGLSFKQAARAATSNIDAITPGQFSAIQGAGQLLLMTPAEQPLFLPMIRH